MFRSILCSLVILGACVGFAAADKEKTETKDKTDKKAKEAKIVKMDSKKSTVVVKLKDEKGKEVEKTFKLAEDIEYMDSTGKVATVEIFTLGDMVLIVEAEGKVSKLKKCDKKDVKKKPESK